MFRFNRHNPTEREVVRLLAYGEGIITKERFLSVSNRTMLSRFRTAGLLKEKPDAEKGVFQITDKFKQAYLQQIDPDMRFAGSGSVTHSAIVQDALRLIPSTATLTSGEAIKRELEQYQKTADYHNREADLRAWYKQERERAKEELRQAQTPMGRYEALDRYNFSNRFFNSDKLVSAPDFKAELTSGEIDQMLSSLMDRYYNDERLTEREQKFTHEAIRTLQQAQTSMTGATVTIFFEAVTGNYQQMQIEQKENCSIILGAPIVYFAG